MTHMSSRRTAAVLPVALLAFTGMTHAVGGESSAVPADDRDELLQRIEQLESTVATLRSQQEEGGIDARRAAEIRDLVEDVLIDADSRASLQGAGMTAGWDKGFFLASPDNAFRLNIKGYMQFRYIYNHVRDDVSNESQGGFEMSRAQLFFTGHVVDPSWKYFVQGNFSRNGGGFTLFDAWVRKVFEGGFSVRAGQFRAPMLREFLVIETKQLAVDRSLINEAFGAARTQGVELDWRNDLFHVSAAYGDGTQSSGGANNGWETPTTEYAVMGRVEAKFGGTWEQFADFSSFDGQEFGALLGGAVLYQRGEAGSRDAGVKTLLWTVDASMNFSGASLFAAFVGRHLSGSRSQDQYGLVVQGGFFVTPEWELYGRYEWGDGDDGFDNLSVVTAGVNWFLAKQQLKWTTDVGYGFNPVSPTFGDPSNAVGWRTDSGGRSGQVVIRTQFQLMF